MITNPMLDFRRVFEAAPLAAIVLSPDDRHTVIAVTDSWLRTTGWCREDLLGRGLAEILGPEAGPVTSVLERIRTSRDEESMEIPAAALCWSSVPAIAPWTLVGRAVSSDEGDVQYLVLHRESVTEVTPLVHDFSQPVSVIGISLDLLEDALEGDRGRSDVERAHRALGRLRELVGALPDRLAPGTK